MYKKTILKNGLTIATRYMPNRDSVSLGIWIKVGSRYEQVKINGISHFLEHLLFKGTARRSCEQIKQSIEGIGGSLNAFTSEETTCYLAKVPAKLLSKALDVLWDMVLNATLSGEDIEMERRVILEEIRMYKDLPSHYVTDLLSESLWPGQPLGLNIAGETKSVSHIQRKDLTGYRDHFYRLNNIVVVVSGNVSHKQVLEECKRHISCAKRGKIKKFVKVRQAQAGPRLKLQVKDTEQAHLALGVHGLARTHPDRFCLRLLHVILGANMSSRLFQQVREERGLAYEINTAIKLFQDTGAFIVHAGIDNRRLVEALEVILGQLSQMKTTKVAEEELKRAKEYYIGQLTLALENTAEQMLWLGERIVCGGRLLSLQEVIKRIKRIDAADITDLANKIFINSRLNLALIGPVKNKDKEMIKKRLTF
ncbi:MAG: insulinase family protein [Candidatus Omnitrophica bacterium]|nr:insulinase family protein [Candidatus Omnitrophota bacterium]